MHTRLPIIMRGLLLAGFLALAGRLGADSGPGPLIDEFEPLPPTSDGVGAVDEIFADVSRDRLLAARKTLGWLNANGSAQPFIAAAQRMIYLKGTDSHDYKFSAAALEDYQHLAPELRNRFLAASVFWLKGSGAPDSPLVARTRAVL